jgi:3-hydroxyisobutyrate dehydrogenase-like beta-hydroxyacid dehydrogenase
MQVEFIGLGIMGASMVANLQKAGYQLVVHDLRQDSAVPHLKAGAKWADSPKSLAAQSKVNFTSQPGPPEVEAVGALIQWADRGDGETQRLV